jgi:hypothetical protein
LPGRRGPATLIAVCVLLTGCARGKGKDDRVDLQPRFAPDEASPSTTDVTAGGGTAVSTTTPTTRGGAPAGRTPPAQVPAPVVAGATTAAVVDRLGDLTPSPADPPPPWADLAGATVIRRADGFELRVKLGGGTAPSTTDEDHTMNIASFFDVDGDGSIDFEVWANLASGGWGSSYFDNVNGKTGFQDASGASVQAEGADVVVRFPLSHLGNAERFRWALASEWGRYEVLGTVAMARDDMPDDDGAARFPG